MLKNVLTQIKQVQSLGQGLQALIFNKSWVTRAASDVSQGTMLFLVHLPAFTMYSVFSGVVCAAYLNGNVSPIGRRIMGSPFSKENSLSIAFDWIIAQYHFEPQLLST